MEQKQGLIKKTRNSLIAQVAVLFLLGTIFIGGGSYLSQRIRSGRTVLHQMESVCAYVSKEVTLSVKEYTSYNWLFRYWYEHADEMDIEYDKTFTLGTRTKAKSKEFADRHPDMVLRYINMQDIVQLSEEDQKAYAEIAYSWLIIRLNEIKQSYNINYLFLVRSEPPYDEQFFLLSAADPGAIRGTEYEQVYPIGVVSKVGEGQQQAMRDATQNNAHMAQAGNYVDYYSLLETNDGASILVGLTYDTSGVEKNAKREAWLNTRFAMIFQALMALGFMLLTYLFLIRPLQKVGQNILLYQETKDGAPVRENLSKLRLRNEIGQLSESISSLTVEMDNYTEEIERITAERERIGAELSLATRIQESQLPNIFPPYPDRVEFDLYASMDPAKEVGGDFYDFFMVDDDHLCMIVADVSGKGVPAALFMMASKIILANNVMMGKSPAQVLTDSNASISRHNPEEMFVTVWLGILEISTGKLTAANAGHEYPVLKNGGDFELYKDKHGFVLGGMAGMKYKEYELLLQPGARLFIYTDGVPEAADSDNQLFGTDRMLEALNGLKDTDTKSVLEGVRAAVDGFTAGAEQFDDLTMLCLEYRGRKNDG